MSLPQIYRSRGHVFVVPPPGPGKYDEPPLSASRWFELTSVDYAPIAWRSWEFAGFVARYGCQPISEVEHWPLSKIQRVYKILNSFLKEESKSGAGASQSGRAGS